MRQLLVIDLGVRIRGVRPKIWSLEEARGVNAQKARGVAAHNFQEVSGGGRPEGGRPERPEGGTPRTPRRPWGKCDLHIGLHAIRWRVLDNCVIYRPFSEIQKVAQTNMGMI